jgi:hypothetical protein
LAAALVAVTGYAFAKDGATIVVPAKVVAQAIQRRDVSATSSTKPPGAKLVGVGKYGTGLRDGDVVVSVEGKATPTVEALVQAGLGAAQSGAPKITGKIVRGEATYTVVLEVPRGN